MQTRVVQWDISALNRESDLGTSTQMLPQSIPWCHPSLMFYESTPFLHCVLFSRIFHLGHVRVIVFVVTSPRNRSSSCSKQIPGMISPSAFASCVFCSPNAFTVAFRNQRPGNARRQSSDVCSVGLLRQLFTAVAVGGSGLRWPP